jgi:hypothetical protein
MGAAHILPEMVMLKYNTFKMENNFTCTINGNYRIPATLYGL